MANYSCCPKLHNQIALHGNSNFPNIQLTLCSLVFLLEGVAVLDLLGGVDLGGVGAGQDADRGRSLFVYGDGSSSDARPLTS